jgi:hypothetical protein
VSNKRKYIEIYHIKTGKTEKRFDITGKQERYIERLGRGIWVNLGDDYSTREVEE